VHATVVGEHGDSSVFLFSAVYVGALPLQEFAEQRGLEVDADWCATVEQDVRNAAYRVRDLKGSTRHGIGLAVSGLIRCIGRESGTIIPVSVRVADDLCASLPCVLGGDGPSAPLWPPMNAEEQLGWKQSLDVLREANRVLPL
jgi:L-lactate dehydrogenase